MQHWLYKLSRLLLQVVCGNKDFQYCWRRMRRTWRTSSDLEITGRIWRHRRTDRVSESSSHVTPLEQESCPVWILRTPPSIGGGGYPDHFQRGHNASLQGLATLQALLAMLQCILKKMTPLNRQICVKTSLFSNLAWIPFCSIFCEFDARKYPLALQLDAIKHNFVEDMMMCV